MAESVEGLVQGEDGGHRCKWGVSTPDYVAYHDAEWGRPVTSDIRLFEKICLEGFQSGLSWLTILRKREGFRAAFAGFDFNKVAAFTDEDVERLVQDKAIVRHRGKIVSTVNNAKRAQELVKEAGSLAAFFWSFEPGPEDRPDPVTWGALIANPTTATSTRISKELKKRGWTFVGPTTIYAFMQAMGMVNDHIEGCICREGVERDRAALKRPVWKAA